MEFERPIRGEFERLLTMAQNNPALIPQGNTGGASNTLKPRVGGGTDSDTWWTGGSNVPAQRRSKPKTNLARRPTDFRNSERIESACRKGLSEEKRLKMPGEPNQTVTLSYWLREIKKKVEDCGMDTIFRVFDPTKPVPEHYLLDNWNSIPKEDITNWVTDLNASGVMESATQRLPVCPWDLENLEWSGDMLKDSVSIKLWQDIVSLLPGESGPQIFMAIVTRVQYTSASTTRAFTEDLVDLNLTKEPGMDVSTFATKIIFMIEKIEQCDESTIPRDLSLVVATRFLHTGVTMFDVKATEIFNLCNDDLKARTPRQIVEELKTKYISLVDQKQWPHKNQREKNDEMSAMHAKLNALQQKFDSYKSTNNNQRNQSQVGGSGPMVRDLSNITCHGCGKKGHYKNECPNKNTPTAVSPGAPVATTPPPAWMLKGPASGESEIKTVDGVEYKWCSKCKLGSEQRSMWRQGKRRHVTSECRTKPRAATAPAVLKTVKFAEQTEVIDGPLVFQSFP